MTYSEHKALSSPKKTGCCTALFPFTPVRGEKRSTHLRERAQGAVSGETAGARASPRSTDHRMCVQEGQSSERSLDESESQALLRQLKPAPTVTGALGVRPPSFSAEGGRWETWGWLFCSTGCCNELVCRAGVAWLCWCVPWPWLGSRGWFSHP